MLLLEAKLSRNSPAVTVVNDLQGFSMRYCNSFLVVENRSSPAYYKGKSKAFQILFCLPGHNFSVGNRLVLCDNPPLFGDVNYLEW